ncbi:hypothetical protein C8R44DRAFT_872368 [Mycena epipterygia]|nr:hypothetical protein C8R44DRAFT_872368 [Mycena epipterygia]
MSPCKASSSHPMTQYNLMQLKKEEQRAKTRARKARQRAELKNLPDEEQKAAHDRARAARARYRDSHHVGLRANAKITRAEKYAAKHGTEAYEAKVERKRQKQLAEEGKRRRNVRPRVPPGQGKNGVRRTRSNDDNRPDDA